MADQAPLILLPGLLCDEALWRHQVNALKSLAKPIVAAITHHDRIEALAKDVLAAAPPQFALAALSMGGYVAFEIMRAAPQRVIKLCLCDTSARPDAPEVKERRRILMALSREGQFKGVTPRLLPTLIHHDRMGDKELTGTIMAMAERVGRDAFLRQQSAILNRVDSRPSLKNIRCPVQVIAGKDDALTPPDVMREIADGISGSRLDFIDNCGHLSPLEKPDEVSALMRRWLAN